MAFLRYGFGLACAVALAPACSSSSSNGANPATTSVDDAPTCAAGSFQLSGAVDGVDRSATVAIGSYGLANLGNPSTLSAEFGDGGALKLQWNGTIANGTAAAAKGVLTLPSSGGVLCVGAGSSIEPEGWGGKFLLTGLLHAPNEGACATPASLMPASGELLGCFGYKTR